MNVIQIVIDSLRTDHLGCYGSDRAHTPNIDKLAAESCVFDYSISESLPTVPVRRALSTCKRTFPYQDPPRPKGITNSRYGWRPLPEPHVTTAERLANADYTTGMVVDTYHMMKPAMNFHRFFDSWQWIRGQENDLYRSGRLDVDLRPFTNLDDVDSPRLGTLKQFLRNQQGRHAEEEYQEAQLFSAAAQWIDDNQDEPNFFLWVDSFSPHPPWRVPQRFIDMYDPGYEGLEPIYEGAILFQDLTEREMNHFRAIYAANVTWVDHCVGKLLDKIDACGLQDKTMVMLLSDHGRMLGEYGLKVGMASEYVFPELYKIVSMIRMPDRAAAGKRIATPVHNIDLVATMLHRIGADTTDIDGLDLWPVMAGEQERVREYLISAQQDWHSVWEPGWLYVRGPKSEHLYEIDKDRGQERDLAEANPAKTKEMRDRLDEYVNSRGGVRVQTG